MKKLISILIATVLLATTACAAGNKVVSTPSTGSGTTTTDNTKGVLPIKAALVEIEVVAVVE